MTATDWMDHPDRPCAENAADDYFPAGTRTAAADAKALCHGCPVYIDCLHYAIRHRLEGIWGGTTEEQRNAMMRRSA